MMTQMHFASTWLGGQRRGGEEVVRTVHTALGRGFLILLDSHERLLVDAKKSNYIKRLAFNARPNHQIRLKSAFLVLPKPQKDCDALAQSLSKARILDANRSAPLPSTIRLLPGGRHVEIAPLR